MKNKFKMILLLITVLSFSYIMKAEGEDEGQSTPISISDVDAKVNGIEEKMAEISTDVSALKKLKISGYYQLEYLKSESMTGFDKSTNPYNSSEYIQNGFRIRRGRIKFTYDAGLTQYVFQGDFTNKGYELKDFYLNITDPWTKLVSLTAGVFNRPNYEVEYSSSQRESMERSKVITTLYPKERDLGAMITFKDDDLFKFQFAAFNNTFTGDLSQFTPNFNNAPLYYMARITKELSFPDLGLGIDIGAHARFGNLLANTNKVINSETNSSVVDSSSYKKGDAIGRNWFGVEAQIYWDFLGGVKLMGEYIQGTNTDAPNATGASPIRIRNFSGFYVYFVKNITDEWQFAAKYDNYNPNTKIDAANITSTSDLAINTIGVGIHNYTFSNIRLSLWYDMPKTTTSTNIIDKVKNTQLLPNDPIDNVLTLRLQYKF